jgi:hypothetical protein
VCDGLITAASLLGQLQAERFAPTSEAVAGELEALLAAISFRVCQNAGGAAAVLSELDQVQRTCEARRAIARARRGEP